MCQAVKLSLQKVGQVFCSLQTDLSDGNMWDIGGRIGYWRWGEPSEDCPSQTRGQVKNPAILIKTSSGKKVETLILKAPGEACLQPGLWLKNEPPRMKGLFQGVKG